MESRALERRRALAWALAMSLVVVLVSPAGAGTAVAQERGAATITRTIVDDTGAVVPGATVTATEVSTGVLRTAFSDERGTFRLSALRVGEYRVTAELSGFRPGEHDRDPATGRRGA